MSSRRKAPSLKVPVGYESRRLDQLKPHPRQAALFGDLPDPELQALAADIAARGLQHPVEILPDGTIVAGHQRVRAARLLGWSEIAVVVRHDLAQQGEAAIERHLISDNLSRRHLDPLAIARAYRRLREIECGEQPGRLHVRARGDLRDRLARLLGFSGRHLDRLLQVLRSPIEIQAAYSGGQITLTLAIRAANLPKAAQARIAEEIQAGQPATAAIRRHLPVARQYCTAAIALAALLRALQRATSGLSRQGGRLMLRDDQVAILQAGMALIRRLLQSQGRRRELRASRNGSRQPGHGVRARRGHY